MLALQLATQAVAKHIVDDQAQPPIEIPLEPPPQSEEDAWTIIVHFVQIISDESELLFWCTKQVDGFK